MGTHRFAYLAALGLAIVTALLIVVGEGALGINGPSDPLTMKTELGVFAVGILGAVVARFRSRGMALALFATAFAQAGAAAVALAAGMHEQPGGSVLEILALNGFFAALFAVSALLFRHAARQRPGAAAALDRDTAASQS